MDYESAEKIASIYGMAHEKNALSMTEAATTAGGIAEKGRQMASNAGATLSKHVESIKNAPQNLRRAFKSGGDSARAAAATTASRATRTGIKLPSASVVAEKMKTHGLPGF